MTGYFVNIWVSVGSSDGRDRLKGTFPLSGFFKELFQTREEMSYVLRGLMRRQIVLLKEQGSLRPGCAGVLQPRRAGVKRSGIFIRKIFSPCRRKTSFPGSSQGYVVIYGVTRGIIMEAVPTSGPGGNEYPLGGIVPSAGPFRVSEPENPVQEDASPDCCTCYCIGMLP